MPKATLCHHCKGTTKNEKGNGPCEPCRGEGVLTPKDNKRLALYWQASLINRQKTK